MKRRRPGGAKSVALNAADEVAVGAFLDGRIRFDQISQVIKEVLAETKAGKLESIREVLKSDAWARKLTREKVEELGCGPGALRPASVGLRGE